MLLTSFIGAAGRFSFVYLTGLESAKVQLISAAVIVAGVARFLTPVGLGLLGMGAIVLLLITVPPGRLPKPDLPRIGWPLGMVCALLVLRAAAQVWFFCPYSHDAISYHLPKVVEWVRAGAFTREMGIDTHVDLPAGLELIETWWVVFLHHDVIIELGGIEFLALGSSAAYSLARALGLDQKASLMAALIYSLTPGVYFQAISCMNDGAASATVLAAAALIVSRAPLRLVILAVGLGLMIKATVGYAIPGLVALQWLFRRKPALTLPPGYVPGVLACVGVCLGCFFYLRNAAWFGNPFHPVGVHGLRAATGVLKIQFGPSLPSLLMNLSAIDERIPDGATGYTALLINISGWGPVAFAGILPLIARLRQDDRFRRLTTALLLSGLSALLLVNHDPWFMRFILFVPVLTAIAAADGAARSAQVSVAVLVCLVFQVACTVLPADLPIERFRELIEQPWRERSIAGEHGPLPDDDSIAYFVNEPVHNRGEAYPLYRPDFRRRVLYIRAESPSGIVKEMLTAGVRYLYVADKTLDRASLITEAVRSRRLQRIGEQLYALSSNEPR